MIPLEILKIKDDLRDGFHVLCRVHIDGKQFRMLVDTGSSMTLFNIKKVKEISQNELESNQQQIVAVGSGNIKSKYVVIDEMKIGDIVIKDYKTMLIDLEFINEHFRSNGEPLIDGIIGGDILTNYNAVIDYEKREMKLS
jgi:clan AA aspartic protease (TIGR02281 family)